MDKNDIKKLLESASRLKIHFNSSSQQYQIINKVENKIYDSIYLEFCELAEVCPVCGQSLVICIFSMYVYKEHATRAFKILGCPDEDCAYNQTVLNKLEREINIF